MSVLGYINLSQLHPRHMMGKCVCDIQYSTSTEAVKPGINIENTTKKNNFNMVQYSKSHWKLMKLMNCNY